jgi:excisionase family DNA binding protein
MDKFVTIFEAAKILNISPATIRRMITAGELQAFKRPGAKSLLLQRDKIEALKVPRPVSVGRAKPKTK